LLVNTLRTFPHADHSAACGTVSMTRRPRVSILVVCGPEVAAVTRCLAALDRALRDTVSAEIVVVFDGTSTSERERVQRRLDCGHCIINSVDLGVTAATNQAATVARGEYLAILSGEAEPQPGWLDTLVATADGDNDTGAVAGAIVDRQGKVTEAGRLIWRDGSTLALHPQGSRAACRYDFVRAVDCASLASVLVRRDLFEEIGGFDERLSPDLGAEVDFFLAVRHAGRRVLFHPRSIVVLDRQQSNTTVQDGQREANQAVLREKWGRALETLADPAPTDRTVIDLAVHRARHSPRRILMIDDRLPDPGAGAGWVRSMDVVRELSRDGYAISFHAGTDADRTELQDLGVDVIEGDLISRLASPATFFDAVLVSRPHVFSFVPRLRRHQAQCAVIYDAEALAHRRLERQAELLAAVDPSAARLAQAQAKRARIMEERVFRAADRAVALSAVEAEVIKAIPGHCPVDVIEPRAPEKNRITPRSFAERSGILLVAGWAAPYPSPNSDGLEWFVANVLPIVRESLPSAHLSVTGANPYPEVRRLAGASVSFLGHVDDLAEVYDRARVAIEPVRYGAGVKNKAIEALQHGIPLVASSVGAEGVEAKEELALTVSDHPEEFAARIVTLLHDQRAWEAARAAIARVHARWASNPPRAWTHTVEAAVLGKTVGWIRRHR